MRITTPFLLLVLLGTSPALVAQPSGDPPCGRRCRQGGGGPQNRLYDPKTVETVSGEIVSLDRIAGPNGMGGIHAVLKSDKGETIPVHLGPAWYIDKQAVTLKQGDTVTVRGSRIIFASKPAIVAEEVTKDGQTLRLRDESGIPAWAGARRRGR
jgi:hypothetical protein